MPGADYEFLCDFTALPAGTIVDNQPIGDTGLVLRSPSGGIKKVAGGLSGNVDNISGIAYILLPYDLDPVGTDWRIWVEHEHAGDDTYVNTVQLLGRKSLPGLSDDSEIQNASSSGLKWLLNAGYFVGGRSGHAYQTMLADAGLYYGYGAGVATGPQYAGCIPASHGPLLTGNTGSTPFAHHDSYDNQLATATNNSETTPAFLRLRGIKLDLKSTTNKVKRLWIRHGGIVPTLADADGPGIVNIAPKVAGVSGQEVYAAVHFPSVAPRAVAIYFHANACSEYQHGFASTNNEFFAQLLTDGYVLAVLRGTSDSGGTTYSGPEASDWGSPTPGGTFRDSLITYLQSLFPSLPLFGIGTSMGGATLWGRELREPGTFRAVALISAVTNLSACHAMGAFDDLIDAAYEDVGAWSAVSSDYDPNLNLRALQNVPILALGDTADSTIDTGDNSQDFCTAIAAKGGDATFVQVDSSGHLGAAQFDADAFVPFFEQYLDPAEGGGFSFLVEDETPYVAKGTSVEIPVTIERRNGHAELLTFTLVSPPTGITLDTAEDIASDTILTLNASGSASVGTPSITLRASDGTLTRDYVMVLTVAAAPTASGTDDGLKVDGGTRHRIVASLSAYGNYRPAFTFSADYGTILPSSQGNVCFWEAPAADESDDVEVTITATLEDNPDIEGEVTLIVPKVWTGNATVGRNQYRAFKAVGLSRWG